MKHNAILVLRKYNFFLFFEVTKKETGKKKLNTNVSTRMIVQFAGM